MHIFQVAYDTVSIIVVVEDVIELFDTLFTHDDNFKLNNDTIEYQWQDGYVETCTITNVTSSRGIIHIDSH